MPTQQQYNNIIKSYRKRYLELLQELEGEYDKLQEKFMDRLRKIAEDHSDDEGKLLKSEEDELKEEMDGLSYWLATETRDLIDKYILESAELAIEGHDRATEYYLLKLAEEDGREEIVELIERAIEGVEEGDE